MLRLAFGLVAIVASLPASPAYAQHPSGLDTLSAHAAYPVHLWPGASPQHAVAFLGSPDSVSTGTNDFTGEPFSVYHYGQSEVTFEADHLDGYVLRDAAFALGDGTLVVGLKADTLARRFPASFRQRARGVVRVMVGASSEEVLFEMAAGRVHAIRLWFPY